MTKGNVILTGTTDIPPDVQVELLPLLRNQTKLSLAEPGCIAFASQFLLAY